MLLQQRDLGQETQVSADLWVQHQQLSAAPLHRRHMPRTYPDQAILPSYAALMQGVILQQFHLTESMAARTWRRASLLRHCRCHWRHVGEASSCCCSCEHVMHPAVSFYHCDYLMTLRGTGPKRRSGRLDILTAVSRSHAAKLCFSETCALASERKYQTPLNVSQRSCKCTSAVLLHVSATWLDQFPLLARVMAT